MFLMIIVDLFIFSKRSLSWGTSSSWSDERYCCCLWFSLSFYSLNNYCFCFFLCFSQFPFWYSVLQTEDKKFKFKEGLKSLIIKINCYKYQTIITLRIAIFWIGVLLKSDIFSFLIRCLNFFEFWLRCCW